MFKNFTLKQFYLKSYRFVGFVVLTTALCFLFGYGLILLFFIFNNTWIAPTILTETSDKMLEFKSRYLAATQQEATSQIAYNQAARQIEVLKKQKKELENLISESKNAIDIETAVQKRIVDNENDLSRKKAGAIQSSHAIRSQLALIKNETDKLLAAHVITRDVAAQNMVSMQEFDNALLNNETTLLYLNQDANLQSRKRATILGKSESLDELGIIKTYDDIKQQLLQNANDLATVEETVKATKDQLKIAKDVVRALTNASYMAAMEKGANLAFVSYDNRDIAKVGEPVYDCYLMIIACHKVGTIKSIYNDEQLIDFPVFNVRLSRTVRGFMINLDMTNPKFMGSTVMFVQKPLFI